MTTLEKYAEAVRSGAVSQVGDLDTMKPWALHNHTLIEPEASRPFDWKFWLFQLPTLLISLAILIWALTTKTPHQDLKDARQILKNPVKVVKANMIDMAFKAGLALEFDCKRLEPLKTGGKMGISCSYIGTKDLANEGLKTTLL